MASATYDIWLVHPSEDAYLVVDGLRTLKYVRGFGSEGAVTLAVDHLIPRAYLHRDTLMLVWRYPLGPGGGGRLEMLSFLMKWEYRSDEAGDWTILEGPDQNHLLRRRIIAYAAGSTEASTSSAVDDAMKQVVRENLGASAVAGRNLSAVGLTVQPNQTLGTAVNKAFAWRPLINVLEELNAMSWGDDNPVWFEIIAKGIDADGVPQLVFRTVTRDGLVDRTGEGATDAVAFSQALGNLQNPVLEYNYWGVANYVYGGGPGQEADRRIVEVSASDASSSDYSRTEIFYDTRNSDDTDAAVGDAANEALGQHRARRRFTADLLDTRSARYGLDWDLGYKVPAEAFGETFNGIIKTVEVTFDLSGETVKATIENEELI